MTSVSQQDVVVDMQQFQLALDQQLLKVMSGLVYRLRINLIALS